MLAGGWSLAPRQPESLRALYATGSVGVHLIKPKSKPRYACSLCGKA